MGNNPSRVSPQPGGAPSTGLVPKCVLRHKSYDYCLYYIFKGLRSRISQPAQPSRLPPLRTHTPFALLLTATAACTASLLETRSEYAD